MIINWINDEDDYIDYYNNAMKNVFKRTILTLILIIS